MPDEEPRPLSERLAEPPAPHKPKLPEAEARRLTMENIGQFMAGQKRRVTGPPDTVPASPIQSPPPQPSDPAAASTPRRPKP